MKRILCVLVAVLAILAGCSEHVTAFEISEEEYFERSELARFYYFACDSKDATYEDIDIRFSGSMIEPEKSNLTITESVFFKSDVTYKGQTFSNVKELYVTDRNLYLNIYNVTSEEFGKTLIQHIGSRYIKVPLK